MRRWSSSRTSPTSSTSRYAPSSRSTAEAHVSQPARGPLAADPDNSACDLACGAAAAAALIELAIGESLRPMEELGEALARISATASAGDVGACIESLQVRDLLAAMAAAGSSDSAPGRRQSWPVLMENLRARFTCESHRILFNLLM